MRREKILPEADFEALCDFRVEMADRLRTQQDMNPLVREILASALHRACKLTGQSVPDLRSEEYLKAQIRRDEIAFDKAAREGLFRFMRDVDEGKYRCDHDAGEYLGEPCIFARATEVFAQYLPFRELKITHKRFKRFLLDRGVIFELPTKKPVGGKMVEVQIFKINRINDLFTPGTTSTRKPKGGKPYETMRHDEALGRMLKNFMTNLDKFRHFRGRVVDRECVFASIADVHDFCLRHYATEDLAAHRFGPRSLAKALRHAGVIQGGRYDRVRDGKRYTHLMAFDVKLAEEFYGRYVPPG